MGISGIQMNNQLVPKPPKGGGNISRSGVAQQAFGQNATFGSSLLPSKSRVGNFVSARGTNVRPQYQSAANISRRLNAGQVRSSGLYAAFGTGSSSVKTNYTYDNSSQGWQQLGFGVAQIGLQVMDKLGAFDKLNKVQLTQGNQGANLASKTGGAALEGAMSGLGAGSVYTPSNTDVAMSISNMASCNDFESLSKAIDGAKMELGSMEIQADTLNEAAKTAKDNLKTLDSQKGIAEKGKTDAQGQVGTCEQSVKTTTMSRDRALKAAETGNKEYDSANAEYTKAHDAHVDAQNAKTRAQSNSDRANATWQEAKNAAQTAQTAYDGALQAYNSCPDTVAGPNGTQVPNPQKPALKAKADLAKQQLDSAKQAEKNAETQKNNAADKLKEAETKEQEASDAENTAKSKKQEAYKNLGDLKSKADQAEKTLQNEQSKLDKMKGNLEKAQENLDVANQKFEDVQNQISSQSGIVEMASTFKNDKSSLETAIKDQEKRLKTIKKDGKKEAKNDDKLGRAYDAGEIQEVALKGYSNEALSKMGLSDLQNLKQQYVQNNEPERAARIDKIIQQKTDAAKRDGDGGAIKASADGSSFA